MSLEIPVGWILLAVLGSAGAVLLFRFRRVLFLMRKRPFSRVEVTVIGQGLNERKVFVGSRTFTAKISDVDYQVKEENLFQDPGRLRIRDRTKGIRQRFKVVFLEGSSEPVTERPLDEWTAPPEILRIVQRSTSLSEAVKGLFARAFSPKILIPILIGVAVVILIYFIYSGELVL